jgi:hypothetical protein
MKGEAHKHFRSASHVSLSSEMGTTLLKFYLIFLLLIKDDTNADSENMQIAIPSCELFEAT